MKIGIPKESSPGERRVALIPDSVATLKKGGHEVSVETGAGAEAGFPDESYREKGAAIVTDRTEVFGSADLIFQVRGPGANPKGGDADLALMKAGQTVIAQFDPLSEPESVKKLAERKVAAFSLELMPRITRAQSMDVLSSQATVAGYKAVLVAAEVAPRMFPMFMTAAGTVRPAHVLIVGAGVAGLQAIATAKRLGAIVHAYDVRAEVKEQIESLGAKFVEMELDAGDAQDKGGYAKDMGEDFLKKQRELMTKVVAESHIVVTTAAIPGRKSPVIVTADMVKGMMPGSVIVDLAAERGGNCELTELDKTVVKHGVTILGPSNLPSTVPFHASQMFAKNCTNFLKELTKDGVLAIDMENEIHAGTLLTRDGEVMHPKIRELLGMTNETSPSEKEA
ncbi:MAG: Re/Si-specific NAD(P)(+) transhydrogenase subunit alpha [Planctomycetes bacterium]|nr:Re/Si-specific NAD(P)(+) transhydrogenase subunit alpha [Planctomycetota bacterium]